MGHAYVAFGRFIAAFSGFFTIQTALENNAMQLLELHQIE